MELSYAVLVTNFMFVTVFLLVLHVSRTMREMDDPSVDKLFSESLPQFFDVVDNPDNGLCVCL